MGSGSWDTSTYKSAYQTSYKTKSRDEVFTQRHIHETMDLTKSSTHVRESRDSDEHPESVPFIIALDETGSMGSVPEYIIKNELPKLMDSLMEKAGIANPQVMFIGFGDHLNDDCPLQVGQFESSTELITESLSHIYLEGRGGGNGGESNILNWIIAGNHTSCDHFEKRGKKGYLFTISDEPTHERVSKEALKHLTGMNYEKDYTWQEALAIAEEKFHIFHIHIVHGYDKYWSRVKAQLGEILGDNLLTSIQDNVVNTIVHTVLSTETPTKTFSEPTILTEDSEFDTKSNRRR